jgi:tetratricopeptide (TPR) repeat protein
MATNRDQIDNETRSSVHNLRGINLAESGFFDEAINEFKRAIQTAPHQAQGYENLGTVYADKGELLDALCSYTQALSLEPENPVALHNLGCFLSNFGNRLAAKCFRKAFKIEPDLYEARFNLGLCLAAEEKHEQAIAQFESALGYDEDDLETRFHLALSLIALNNYQRAIKELLYVIKADRSHEQAWYYLALSYQERGFLEEAVNAFSKVCLLNAQNFDAMLNLASLLIRLERKKEAQSLINRAIKLDEKRTLDFMSRDDYLCNDRRLKHK